MKDLSKIAIRFGGFTFKRATLGDWCELANAMYLSIGVSDWRKVFAWTGGPFGAVEALKQVCTKPISTAAMDDIANASEWLMVWEVCSSLPKVMAEAAVMLGNLILMITHRMIGLKQSQVSAVFLMGGIRLV